MLLSYLLEFLAETETAANPLPWEFSLASLSEVVGLDEEERLLCPVRALKWYLHRTKSQLRPRQLFLSV